jgi:RNA polymerase sigma factor (sigma-70 family)
MKAFKHTRERKQHKPVEELETLLARAQNDDLEAYGEIVQRFQDMAVGYARSILKDAHLAEDVAQEAFIEAYLNLSKVYGARAFPSWLRKIVLKFCDRLTRKKQLHFVSIDAAQELRSKDKSPAEILDEKDAKNLVQATLQSLPEQEQTVVNLFYINEFSQREVAAFLDLPVSTVNFRLHSARKQLKKEYLKMTQTNLQSQRPSKDQKFADKIHSELLAVQKLHKSLLPSLQELFSKTLGRDVEVVIREAHQRMFGHYILLLGRHCANYCYLMDPLKKRIYLDLSIPLCTALLEPDANPETVRKSAAAKMATPVGEGGWMSQGDIKHINEHVKVIVKDIEKAWTPVCETKIHDIELETSPSFIPQEEGAPAPCIHLEFEVKSTDYEDLTLSLCYLRSTLEPALPDMQ